MLKVISCFKHAKKDGSGDWFELNLLDEEGHVATGVYSDVQFATGSELTGEPSLVFSKAQNKWIVGVRKLFVKVK